LRTLSALSKVRPTLLIVEDLHWAGRSTLAAIEYVARRAGLQALLVVGTYRNEELGSRAELSAYAAASLAMNCLHRWRLAD